VPVYTRRNGDLTLILRPGYDPISGKMMGCPYGSIPRLLLFWIATEAVRTKSRRLELGDNLSHFMRELGLNPRNGTGAKSDARRLKDQAERLFRASISFERTSGTQSKGTRIWTDMPVATKGELWWDFQSPGQGNLWGSWIELGESFYQTVISAPVPLDMDALKALKRSPLALDLYAWLAFRTFTVRQNGEEALIPWDLLQAQFGADYTRLDNFTAAVRETLVKIRKSSRS